MKTLVVFYSRTGTTKRVADAMVERLGCDAERILDVKSRKGPLGYMRSGKEAMKGVAGDIKEPEKDPADYDMVIVGTPVWGWNVSSPVRAYLGMMREKLSGVAFFCTMGSKGGEKAFKSMEDVSECVPKAKVSFTTKEVKADNFMDRLDSFLGRVQGSPVKEGADDDVEVIDGGEDEAGKEEEGEAR